jgi:sRNA-binding carbon storage regulator CsrA
VYLTCADGTVITVTIATVDRGKVRLTIAAPQSVGIVRGELLTEGQRAELDAKAGAK